MRVTIDYKIRGWRNQTGCDPMGNGRRFIGDRNGVFPSQDETTTGKAPQSHFVLET